MPKGAAAFVAAPFGISCESQRTAFLLLHDGVEMPKIPHIIDAGCEFDRRVDVGSWRLTYDT
jgi:hypothetical protein